MLIDNALTTLGGKFKLKRLINLVADKVRKAYFAIAPIIMPIPRFNSCPSLNKENKKTNKKFPITMNGINGAKGVASCPTNHANNGVSMPMEMPQYLPHIYVLIMSIAFTAGPTKN